ncbi:hypothetical protein FOA52_003221 [Chlamydomonas sp. UWO 241]|nr:hypothetical protein FOA52_003221 [Chlamydomonas sp. UWO 241]
MRALLESRGCTRADVERLLRLAPELDSADMNMERAGEVLGLLAEILGLDGGRIARVCIKHPRMLSSPPGRVAEARDFLVQDLGMCGDDLLSLVQRFPHVLTYPVQAHLRPHVAYLGSLGEEDVAGLVRQRPHVLGEGIESVIKFLQLCRMPRKEIFRLLRSYPLDYCIQLKAPLAIAIITADALPEDGGSSEL